MIGKTVSHYRITRELGTGGMGVVYEAVDIKLDRTVALKFLPPESTRDPDAKARFVHEAKAASALDHPNVCTIYEVSETEDDQLFLAMACYVGETLRERIVREPLPVDEAVEIACQVAAGLAIAHENDVVHRDIKPENIFLTQDGLVKILDFGLAKLAGLTKLTRADTTMGTCHYMSPEQVGGDEADNRSDIWSLGVVLFEMLTGRVPFPGEHPQAVIYAILNRDPGPLSESRTDVPVELDQIVRKCLAKSPENRNQQMDKLRADLLPFTGNSEHNLGAGKPVTFVSRKIRRFFWIGAFALIVAMLGLGATKILISEGEDASRRSVAVLPFKTIVIEPGNEWFSDGMTEAIVGHLTKIEDLKVTSRTSTSQFRDSTLPIKEIAEQLGVATILEGSVQQTAGRIHLMVKLIDARTDDHIWAEDYERQFIDVFALQTDIALQVVGKLEATLTSDVTDRIKAQPTRELEAYRLVREGIDLWRGSFQDRNLAMGKLEQAVEIDPNYAEAYGHLASFSWLSTVYGNRPPMEMFPRAKGYALKALELDETIIQAHATLGFIKNWWDRDWSAAEQHWKILLKLAPGAAGSYSGSAWYMMQVGRFDEAITLYSKAVDLNPLSAGSHQNMGEIFYYARRYDEAITVSLSTVKRFPSYLQTRTILGLAYLGKGMKEEALEALHADLDLSQGLKPEIDHLIGFGLASAGDTENARKVLDLLLKRYEEGWASLFSIAEIYFAMGETDKGFEYLEEAEIERDPRLSYLKISPSLDGVREDPRYLELLKKIGLAE